MNRLVNLNNKFLAKIYLFNYLKSNLQLKYPVELRSRSNIENKPNRKIKNATEVVNELNNFNAKKGFINEFSLINHRIEVFQYQM